MNQPGNSCITVDVGLAIRELNDLACHTFLYRNTSFRMEAPETKNLMHYLYHTYCYDMISDDV
jgi:hypothetical protein